MYRAVDQVKVTSSEIVTDAAAVYPAVLDELISSAWHHVERYANNPIEADHSQLKPVLSRSKVPCARVAAVPRPRRSTMISVAAWSAGVAVSAAGGLTVLTHVGNRLPLEAASVRTYWAPQSTRTDQRSDGDGAPKAVVDEVPIASVGGTVLASCAHDLVYLVSWSPALGHEATDIARGPATDARLTFVEPGHHVTVVVRCRPA